MMGRARLGIRIGATVAALLATLVIAGCGGAGGSTAASSGSAAGPPKHGGTLRISLGEEVVTLDRLTAIDGQSINVIRAIDETLFKVNSERKIEPLLVSSFGTSDGQRVWTFHLREGVTFSDGRPLGAEDVVFSIKTAMESPSFSSLFEGLDEVKATAPSTVVVRSTKPMPELPGILTEWFTAIVPKNYGGESEQQFAQKPIGTGPFLLGPWKHGESLTLERNPHYWQSGKPYLSKVVLKAVPEDASRAAELRAGELDVIRNPPIAQLDSLNNTSGLHVEEYASGLVYFLILNSHSPLFQDPRVREAVDLAIDRNGILRTALNGSGEVAGSWVPPAVLYHDSSIRADRQDVAKAKKLVAEAVEEDKLSPKLTLSTEAGLTFWSTTGQILQQNLEDIGFSVSIRPSDGPTHIEALERGDYDVASLSMYTELPTPLEMVAFYNGTGGLWSGADTNSTTTLLQQASSAASTEARHDHYDELQEIIDREHYILPLVYEPYIYAMQEDVAGFEVSSTGTLWLTDVGFSK